MGVVRVTRWANGRKRPRDDDVDLEIDQLGGERVQPFDFLSCVASLDDEVTAFDVSEIPEPRENGVVGLRDRARVERQEPDARGLRRRLPGGADGRRERCSQGKGDEHSANHAMRPHSPQRRRPSRLSA